MLRVIDLLIRWQTLAGLLINVAGYAWIMGFTADATRGKSNKQ